MPQRKVTLDYETPLENPRKDAVDYYREPPDIASWTIVDLLIWILSILIVFFLVAAIFGWYFGK